MKNVRVLDCTLRDGGRIIDCSFGDAEIVDIISRLTDANLDVIEVGFLRDGRKTDYVGNSTFFTNVNQICQFIPLNRKDTIYSAFVDFGMFDIDSLDEFDGKSINAIRFGFTKKDFFESHEEVLKWAKKIKNKGYKLFVQGVNSLSYSIDEFKELVEEINDINPYSFGIVDTYGAMYLDDVIKYFDLINNCLDDDVCIDFHSHNNFQLSFALSQEVIKISQSTNRKVIIDCTLGGMGKIAGNLNTELIANFLIRKLHYDYDFEGILDIYDDYIYKYYLNNSWGYSIAGMLAGEYKSHPNNVIYLTDKFRINTKDIGRILSMIPPEKRQRYDYDCIERLYTEYIADKVDDHESINALKDLIEGKEVLILVPGGNLNVYRKKIDNFIDHNNPVVVSINHYENYSDSIAFFGNKKRYERLQPIRKGCVTIVTSNIVSASSDIVVDYYSLINREYKNFENSTVMLLTLLKRLKPSKVFLAGFDGFNPDNPNNFMDESYQNDRHKEDFDIINTEISQMVNEIVEAVAPDCEYYLFTPSLYKLNISVV